MTDVCGGGISRTKTGAAAVVSYSAGLLASIFALGNARWLIPIVPFVGLAPLALDSFCQNDPPDIPTFTQAEVDALIELKFGADFDSGADKFRDVANNAIWFDACECASVSTPPFAPPVRPPGSISVLPARGDPVVPCFSTGPFITPASTLLSGVSQWQHLGYVGAPLPTIRIGMKRTPAGANHSPIQVRVRYQNAIAGTFVGNSAWVTLPVGDEEFATFPNLLDANDMIAETNNPSGNTDLWDQEVDVACNGETPGGAQLPCCPPDTSASSQLAAILDLVRSIQRNYAPFGYIKGTSHPLISGTGSVAVSRLIGLQLEVTSYPAGKQQLLGNPAYVKDLGWLSVSEVDGMIQERRVAQLGFTWFPQLMPIADHINYALQEGVVVTITELQPEP